MKTNENGVVNVVSNVVMAGELGLPSRSVVSEVKRLKVPYRYVGGLYLFDKQVFLERFFSEENMRCCGKK
jgi:hypothetical protein